MITWIKNILKNIISIIWKLYFCWCDLSLFAATSQYNQFIIGYYSFSQSKYPPPCIYIWLFFMQLILFVNFHPILRLFHWPIKIIFNLISLVWSTILLTHPNLFQLQNWKHFLRLIIQVININTDIDLAVFHSIPLSTLIKHHWRTLLEMIFAPTMYPFNCIAVQPTISLLIST